MASPIVVQLEVSVSPLCLWKALLDSTISFPKAMPSIISSIEDFQGTGCNVGNIRLIKFVPGIPVEYVKERLDSIDESTMTVVASLVEGGIVGSVVSSLKGTINLQPKGDGTLVTWTLDYEPLVENPDLGRMKDIPHGTFKALEAYLLSSDDYN